MTTTQKRIYSSSTFNLDNTSVIESMGSYERLAYAIIIQAVKDYRRAKRTENLGVLKECERFFGGSWFEVLTDIPGKLIIERLRQENVSRRKKR